MHVCVCVCVCVCRLTAAFPFVFTKIDSVSVTVRITQVLIQDSHSGDRGGAIMFRSGSITPSVDLSWSTVQNATSMRGGSLFAEGAVLVVDAAEFLNTTGPTARVQRGDAQCGLHGRRRFLHAHASFFFLSFPFVSSSFE